jgi:hypothetical protein
MPPRGEWHLPTSHSKVPRRGSGGLPHMCRQERACHQPAGPPLPARPTHFEPLCWPQGAAVAMGLVVIFICVCSYLYYLTKHYEETPAGGFSTLTHVELDEQQPEDNPVSGVQA